MTRPKGTKDHFPRYFTGPDTRFRQRTLGFASIVVRLYGPEEAMHWFASLDSQQRGGVVVEYRRQRDGEKG